MEMNAERWMQALEIIEKVRGDLRAKEKQKPLSKKEYGRRLRSGLGSESSDRSMVAQPLRIPSRV